MASRKCGIGNHEWQWVKNIGFFEVKVGKVKLKEKGFYKCECGTSKCAEPKNS